MEPLLIVKTGSTLPSLIADCGDFEDWIVAGMGLDRDSASVVAVFEGRELPDPERFAGIVVTGSSAMVSHREAWTERAAEWLRDAVRREKPVLGICYGHQLLAHALGGRVGPNPRGRQIGTVGVRPSDEARRDALLAGLERSPLAHVTHSEVVLELPEAAVRLGSSEKDPNAAFSFGRAAWGVQFHPEFDSYIMKCYIDGRRELLSAEGIDADACLAGVEECPAGPALLRRFCECLAGRI